MLDLSFRRDPRGRSVLSGKRQRFPLRMTVPFYLDPADPGMAFVYVQNPTGGVFAGDRLFMRVAASRDVRVHLTTQSATKLYRMDNGEARQDLRFELEPGAYVEHIPDALIPQQGTRFHQRTVVDVAPGAAFVGAETIGPGRRAHGERFAYDSVTLTTEVWRAGREICTDTMRLQPPRARPDRRGVLSRHDYLVSLLVVAPERDSARLAAAIDDALADEPSLFGGAGELPHQAGAVARILCDSAPDAQRALRTAWRTAREQLLELGLPAVRK